METISRFIQSLFDVSFSRFITIDLIKVIYILNMVLAAGLALSVIASSFAYSFTAGVWALLFLGPVTALVYMIFVRLALELVIVIFRIADHAKVIAENSAGR